MPDSWTAPERLLDPLELLFQATQLPRYDLPSELEGLYGGPFGLPADAVYSNFVSSLDGVAVVGPSSGSQLSGKNAADRFVMGLLRACADAILIGAGTLKGSPGHVWTAAHVFPPQATAYRELRRRLGLREQPTLVVASGSGKLDLDHPGLARPALLLTSESGRDRLARSGHQVVAIGNGPELDPVPLIETIRQAGYRLILTEGGPTLMGQLLGAGQVDQLFLTVSPILVGRPLGERRPGFVDGLDLLAGERPPWLELLTVRRHRSHLFLHYLAKTRQNRSD
ncbi:MAG: RibD family protein [Candidatus Dormibacteria bacterium]